MSIRVDTSSPPALVQQMYFQLQSVCRDGSELMSLDTLTGDVRFRSTPPANTIANIVSDLADTNLVEFVISSPHPTTGQVMDPDFGLVPLCAGGVYVFAGSPGAGLRVDIVYDSTNLFGSGYIGYDVTGNEIALDAEQLLAYGIGWAAGWFAPPTDEEPSPAPGNPPGAVAIAIESTYRTDRSQPLRATPLLRYGKACPVKPHEGMPPPSNDPPPKKASQGASRESGGIFTMFKNCFVATAAYGGPLDPEVVFLRAWRDEVLTRTRVGEDFFRRFHKHYYEFSPALADAMRADPELMAVMRTAIVEPLLRWLRLTVDMPDAPLDGVPEPWAGFLRGIQRDLDRWAGTLPLPESFDGLRGVDAARELGVVLRFWFHDPAMREAYVRRLEASGALPLRLVDAEADLASEALLTLGRPPSEVARLVARTAR